MSTDWSFDPQTGELHNEPPRNVSEYTVSELSFALKRTLEDSYGYVRVRGEIGRVTNPGSGHCYLDLKDAPRDLDRAAPRASRARPARQAHRARPAPRVRRGPTAAPAWAGSSADRE